MALIVVVQNISELAPVSDYGYEVLVGDGTSARSRVITKGEIKAHVRSDGWKTLIQRVIDESE